MAKWQLVGGDSGVEGDPWGAQIYGGETPPSNLPMQQIPAENFDQPTGLYSFPDQTPAPARPSFWEDPLNFTSVADAVSLHPEYLSDPSFDFETFKSLKSRLDDKNKGKLSYEWAGLTPDDPEYGLLQSMKVPSFIQSDPAYAESYDANGYKIIREYVPNAELQTTADASDLNPSPMSPIEQTMMGLLPAAGKTVGTVGMGLQGMSVAGLPGLVLGGAAGLGMASADPTSETWLNKVFMQANNALDVGAANVEGFLGMLANNATEGASIYDAKALEAKQKAALDAQASGYQTPGELLLKMATGSDAEKAAAREEWNKSIVAGQTYYEGLTADGALSVPGKAVSLFSRKVTDNDPIGETGVEEASRLGTQLYDSVVEAIERRGEVWGFEGDKGWQPPEDKAALEAAYTDVKMLLDQGVAPKEALQQVNQRFGLGGVMADLVGHAVIDPLNLVGVGLMKAAATLGKGARVVKALEVGDTASRFVAKAVSKMTFGLSDDFASPQFSKALAESRDVLDLSRNMGIEVRAAGAQNATKMSYFTRQLAGVDSTGNYKRFMTPGDPEHMSTWSKVANSLLFGTREARASEMLSHITQGLANNLAYLDNADDIVKMIDQLASMSPADAVRASESGKLTGWVDNVMSQSAPAAVKDGMPKIRALAATFQDSRPQAMALTDLATALGTTPRKLVNELASLADDKMASRWKYITGKFPDAAKMFKNGAELRAQAQLFVPNKGANIGALPLTLDDFKAHTLNALAKNAADFSVNYFGVKQSGWVWQISNTVKKAQGLLLLGVNPAYFMNNGINNAITLAYDGLFNIPALFQADSFLTRWGDEVVNLQQGQKLETVTGVGQDAIRDAMRPQGGFSGRLGKVQNVLDKANRSKLAFATAASNYIEQASSKMANVAALQQVWPKMWKRGTGFDEMPAELARALDELSPGMSKRIYSGIENSMSGKEITSNVFGDLDNVTVRDIVDEKSFETLQSIPGLVDALDTRLKTARTKQDVMDAYSSVRSNLTEYTDKMAVEAAQEWAEHAAAVARTEGVHSVLNMVDEMGDFKADTHIEHFRAMDAAAERAAMVEGKQLKSSVWSQARKRASESWTRYRRMEKAKMVGIAKGMGASDEMALNITDGLDRVGKIWDEFYANADTAYKAHADKDYANFDYENDAFRKLQAKLDRAYSRAHAAEKAEQAKIDTAFGEMFEGQFPGSRQAALDWRKQVADATELQYEAMSYFRGSSRGDKLAPDIRRQIDEITAGQDLNSMSAEVRQTVWGNFLNDVYEPMLVDRAIKSRQANEVMLTGAGKQAPVSPEEMDAVRAARVAERETLGEVGELEDQIDGLAQEIARTQEEALRNPTPKFDEEGLPAGNDSQDISDYLADLQDQMADLQAKRNSMGVASDAPAAPLSPEQAQSQVYATLASVPRYANAGNPLEVMRRAGSKYLGRKITDLSQITPEEAVLIVQRQAAAQALGLKRGDVLKRLKAIERELDLDMADDGKGTVAAVAPSGVIDRLSPLPPYKEAVMQGVADIHSALDTAEASTLRTSRGLHTEAFKNAPDEVKAQLDAYMQQVSSQMSESKNTATKIAKARRDFALLDYNDRYGFDNYLGAGLPYQFWYTRSMKNWGLRVLTRPEILHRYALLQQAGQAVSDKDLPKRMWGKIKIPISWMPEEFGDGIYVDLNRQGFPFIQIWKAMKQVNEDKNMLNERTRSILQDQLERQDITPAQLREALSSTDNDLYKQAEAEASTQIELDIRNPADFIGAMSGWSLPIQWYLNREDPERISQLPIAKTIENITYMLGRGFGATKGVDIEQPIRKGLGLPEETKYEPFYINRALAAMASDAQANGGQIKGLDGKLMTVTPDDFRRAEIDRSGKLYDLAQRKVSDMGVAKWLGSPVGADFMMQGEERQRAVKQEYGLAMDTDDPDAYKKFTSAFPEYKVQQDAWKPADDRMRNYLKDLVWTSYFAMPKAKQQDFADQMGDEFNLLFMNKDTRNYDAIETETLSQWAKTMGAELPDKAGNIPGAPMKWSSPEVVGAMSQYYQLESQQFPGLKEYMQDIGYWEKSFEEQDKLALDKPEIMVYNRWRDSYLATHPEIIQRMISPKSTVYGKSVEVQAAYYNKRALKGQMFPTASQMEDGYFALPEKSQARRDYLAKNPQLKQYWDWSTNYDKQYLPLSVEWASDNKIIKAFGGVAPTYKPEAVINEMSDELSGRVVEYLAFNKPLSSAAKSELEILRKKYAKGETLETFLATIRAGLLSSQSN